MKIVALSDTHGSHDSITSLPDGDILVVAGDITAQGLVREVEQFDEWLGSFSHPQKIVIAGNHDFCFADDRSFQARTAFKNAIYLENESFTYEGVNFYGSPWTPKFGNWAFMARRGDPINKYWRMIPDNTDVLITHGPPKHVLDKVNSLRHRSFPKNLMEASVGNTDYTVVHSGCGDLAKHITDRVKPKVCIFGHIHEGYGSTEYANGGIRYYNVSRMNRDYEPVNEPQVIEL